MPRLFVAINFPEEVTDKLFCAASYLKQNSQSANISRKENLHLTLSFIGETGKIKSAVSALNRIETTPLELTLEGFGEFRAKDGSICFAKISENEKLSCLAKSVRDSLLAYKFDIDTKPFKPHITLCRQFKASDSFQREEICKLLGSQSVSVGALSLMRSDRINGRLVYTEIYKKIL